MKKITTIIALLTTALLTNAQDVLYNNGSILQVNAGCLVQINGNLTNTASSTFANNGSVTVQGNITNNQVMALATTGVLKLNGSSQQTISGTTPINAFDVEVNNTNGIQLDKDLVINGTASFMNGIVTQTVGAGSKLVKFTANGIISTIHPPTNTSHVNATVEKEGTGLFTYPVGDGISYQKVAVNLASNSSGMRVIYKPSNAGAGPFVTTGSSAIALVAYNPYEYWDITPNGSATGMVTIFWDAYKNAGISNINDLQVAHLQNGNWLNEGNIATGTVAAGSVSSNSISTWSPFTLGSIGNSTLPIIWLNVSGNLNIQKQAVINFKINETNVANYVIEKSIDGRIFSSIATISSKGNGTNNYTYTDAASLEISSYYRIKQIDKDGRFSYSSIIKLTNNQINSISIYPNPVKDIATISGAKVGSKAIIFDLSGKVLQQISVTQTTFTIDISNYTSGIYLIKLDNGATQKIIKE